MREAETARKRHTAEQIISKLRQAEVELAKGQPAVMVCRKLGITEQTFYRWKKKYGGLGVSELRELKRMVADLSLDKQMLREVVEKKL